MSKQANSKPVNLTVWSDIPAKDLKRASRFYEALLGVAPKLERFGPHDAAIFAAGPEGTGFSLLCGDGMTPRKDGATPYLTVQPSIDEALRRARAAGGTVAMPKTPLPDGMGYIAQLVDTEGNRVGLHAMA